jgi:hypothetical protein
MGEEKAPGRIQLVSVGMSTVGTASGGDVFHSVPFTGVVRYGRGMSCCTRQSESVLPEFLTGVRANS